MEQVISLVRVIIEIAAVVIVVVGLIHKDWVAAGVWAVVFLMAVGG